MESAGEKGLLIDPNHQLIGEYRANDVHCLRRRLELLGSHLGLVGFSRAHGRIRNAHRLLHAGKP